jgi:mannitol-1-/sugar-/sorbitol-6-phosphatase
VPSCIRHDSVPAPICGKNVPARARGFESNDPLSSGVATDRVRFTCDALLFDLDGTLVDSTACIEAIWRTWAAHHRLDVASVLRIAPGRRTLETVRATAPHLDAATEVEALLEQEARGIEGLCEIEGARALIQGLPPSCWAVVTSGARAVAEHRLRQVGLPIPEVMVCAADVHVGKPDPEGFLAAAARLGVAPHDCIVIEDAPLGLDAAHAAGMRSIAVATTHGREDLRRAVAVLPALSALKVHVNDGRRPGRLEIGFGV